MTNTDLHAEARRRARALRDEAIDRLFRRLLRALRAGDRIGAAPCRS